MRKEEEKREEKKYAVNKDTVVHKEQSGAEQREALLRQPEGTRQPDDYYVFYDSHVCLLICLY